MNSRWNHRVSCLLIPFALIAVASAPFCMHAQSSSTAAKPATPGDTNGFSIETEMLTYRALESNGEAIACDVAAYLYNTRTDFRKDASGSECNITNANPTGIGVVVLPFDRSVFSDFQIWRSDMQTMAEFESRGASACAAPPAPAPAPAPADTTAPPGRPQGRGLTAANTAIGLLPGGNMVSAAAGVLGLFASDHASSPVGGTIQDQAFMDNVSRELRTVNVAVLMPSVYTPFGLDSIDATHSPFLISLDKLLQTHDCIVRARGAADPDAKSIEQFLAVLSGPTTTTAPVKTPAPAPASTTTTTITATETGTPATPAPAAQPAPAAPSHLEADLSADGLAQRLGVDPVTGKIPDTAPQHLLLIKALESGGSVTRSTNIFGSKMSYSGGSVGTYALFGLDGELECSGNVYDYAGPVPARQFQKNLRAYAPDPAAQVIFQRGACRAH